MSNTTELERSEELRRQIEARQSAGATRSPVACPAESTAKPPSLTSSRSSRSTGSKDHPDGPKVSVTVTPRTESAKVFP